MKKTKITAAVLAALMLAGCGKVEGEITPAAATDNGTEMSAETPVSDSSEASAESSDTSSESESAETKEVKAPDGAAGYSGTYINDKNCILISGLGIFEDGEDEDHKNSCKENIADRQLLYYCAERMIDQYNCIADRDKRGFFDTIGYSGVFKSENAAKFRTDVFLEEQDNNYIEGGVFDRAFSYANYLIGDRLYPDDLYNTDYTRDDVLAEYREIMDKAAEKATFENSEEYIDEYTCFNHLFYKKGSIADEEYFASPEKFRLEPSDDTIYIINMYNGRVSHDNDGNDAAVLMSVTVLDGDYAYEFGSCDMWLTENGGHVMPFEVAVCENTYKGTTREEIEAEKTEEIRNHSDRLYREAPLPPAEVACGGANYHFCEGIYEGSLDDADNERTIWQMILDYGTYARSVSDEGLDISAEISYDSREEFGIGDYQIVYEMHDNGYFSGTVWLRPEPDGSGDFYVIYESIDGQREEYHNTLRQ